MDDARDRVRPLALAQADQAPELAPRHAGREHVVDEGDGGVDVVDVHGDEVAKALVARRLGLEVVDAPLVVAEELLLLRQDGLLLLAVVLRDLLLLAHAEAAVRGLAECRRAFDGDDASSVEERLDAGGPELVGCVDLRGGHGHRRRQLSGGLAVLGRQGLRVLRDVVAVALWRLGGTRGQRRGDRRGGGFTSLADLGGRAELDENAAAEVLRHELVHAAAHAEHAVGDARDVVSPGLLLLSWREAAAREHVVSEQCAVEAQRETRAEAVVVLGGGERVEDLLARARHELLRVPRRVRLAHREPHVVRLGGA
mmetsp:Transcript_49582/g.153081  ORF Transcript_49582/g.153081 Transcript_49582/m.153081 type:complete len:312 (+) Transcript_49582:817-1752(+)